MFYLLSVMHKFQEHMEKEKQNEQMKSHSAKWKLMEENKQDKVDRMIEEDMEDSEALVWKLANHWLDVIIRPEVEQRQLKLITLR